MLTVGATACGSDVRGVGSASRHVGATAAAGVRLTVNSNKRQQPRSNGPDDDQDAMGNPYYEKDDDAILQYGHLADPHTRHTVASLVDGYYAAAAAGDGMRACAAMYSLLAESIAEEYGEPPGPLHGTTCAAVLSKFFGQYSARLRSAAATLMVTGVRIHRKRGLVLFNYRGMHNRHLGIHLEHGVWKVNELIDSGLP